MPAWVTNEDIQFDGTTREVAILQVVGDVKTVALWDVMTASDQALLEAVVNDYGGTVPLAGPTAGYQRVVMSSAVVGATATGLANDATVYTTTVVVDGVTVPVAVTGSAAQTYTTLLAAITTDITASGATIAIVSGNLKITSPTTGVTSTISIIDDLLFRRLTQYSRIEEPKEGATNIVTVLQGNRSPNGEFLFNLLPIKYVGLKPPSSASMPKTPEYLYFGGTPATWRYLADDTEFVVGGGGGGGDFTDPNFTF